MFGTKRELMETDLRKFEYSIHLKYQEASTSISIKRDDVTKHSKKLKTALDKQR